MKCEFNMTFLLYLYSLWGRILRPGTSSPHSWPSNRQKFAMVRGYINPAMTMAFIHLRKWDHLWFRYWRNFFSLPSLYLNRCWLFNWAPRGETQVKSYYQHQYLRLNMLAIFSGLVKCAGAATQGIWLQRNLHEHEAVEVDHCCRTAQNHVRTWWSKYFAFSISYPHT